MDVSFDVLSHPCYKLIGLAGFLMDVVYPWLNWYLGGIRWDLHASGQQVCAKANPLLLTQTPTSVDLTWKVALLLASVIWSISAIAAIAYACTYHDADDKDDTVVEVVVIHIVIAVIASVLLVIDNALAGNLIFMILTFLLRTLHLVCVLCYFREIRRAKRENAAFRDFISTKCLVVQMQAIRIDSDSSSESEEDPLEDYFRYRKFKRMGTF